MDAAPVSVTCVDGTGIIVIAVFPYMNTVAFAVTYINSAGIAVVAIFLNMNASFHRIA
jgi:uncharacterized membrane protein